MNGHGVDSADPISLAWATADVPLLPGCDPPRGKLAAQYGRGRIAFLLDKQGIVRHVEKGMPDNQKLWKRIKEIGQ